MSAHHNIWLISDTHFGHSGILNFFRADGITKVRPFNSVEEMDETMVANWNAVVRPYDKVYHLGDVVINRKALKILSRLNGKKRLVRGNHDIFRTKEYSEYFEEIYGVRVLDDMILSHIPLARESITSRFGTNVHGHTHSNFIADPAYLSVCVEHINFAPIHIDQVRARIATKKEQIALGYDSTVG